MRERETKRVKAQNQDPKVREELTILNSLRTNRLIGRKEFTQRHKDLVARLSLPKNPFVEFDLLMRFCEKIVAV